MIEAYSDDEIFSEDARSSTPSSEYQYSEGCDEDYTDVKMKDVPKVESDEYLFLNDDDDVLKLLDDEVEDIRELVGEDYSASLQLLRKHKWNKTKSKETFLQWVAQLTSSDHIEFCDHFDLPTTVVCLNVRYPGGGDKEDEQCFVCCDNISANNPFVSLGCDHFFCLSCYVSYWGGILTTNSSSTSRPDPFSLRCMDSSSKQCNFIATPPVVVELFSLSESLTTPSGPLQAASDKQQSMSFLPSYKKWLRTIFVEESASLQSCASAGSSTKCNLVICKQVARSSNVMDEYSPCTCRCGFQFCFGCFSPSSHHPATCTAIRNFNAASSSQEAALLLAKDTKRCPNCTMVIQKDGGCNHMRCRSCQHEFCWVCLQHCPRHHHPSGGCNKPPRDVNAEERWKHYWNRYLAHRESERHEQKALELRKAQLAHERDDVEPDQLVVSCTETLLVCRSTLKYTYVHAHWLSEQRRYQELDLFECQQQDLENHTERLSGLVTEASVAVRPHAPMHMTVCPVPSCQSTIDTRKRPRRQQAPQARYGLKSFLQPAAKPTSSAGVESHHKGDDSSDQDGDIAEAIGLGSVTAIGSAASTNRAASDASAAAPPTASPTFAYRAAAIVTCPKCTHQFCSQCLKQCPESIHPAIACVAIRKPGVEDSGLPTHLIESLRNQQSAAKRFLSNLLSGDADAYAEMESAGGGSSSSSAGAAASASSSLPFDSEEATAAGGGKNTAAAIVHSSWYCAICSESKKSCCCVVSEIMKGGIGEADVAAEEPDGASEGFPDRAEVERALLQTNRNKALAIAMLKRKRDGKGWEERFDWFAGLKPDTNHN